MLKCSFCGQKVSILRDLGFCNLSQGKRRTLTNNDSDSPEEVEEKYEYDIFGRLTAKSSRVVDFDNYAYTTYYEYDYSGKVTKITYPYNATGGGGAQAFTGGESSSENLVLEDMTLQPDAEVQYTSDGDIIFTGEFNSNGAELIATPGVRTTENTESTEFALSQDKKSSESSVASVVPISESQTMGNPDPNATVVTYTYNSFGQLASIGNATDPDYFAAYTYNPDGSMAPWPLVR